MVLYICFCMCTLYGFVADEYLMMLLPPLKKQTDSEEGRKGFDDLGSRDLSLRALI